MRLRASWGSLLATEDGIELKYQLVQDILGGAGGGDSLGSPRQAVSEQEERLHGPSDFPGLGCGLCAKHRALLMCY